MFPALDIFQLGHPSAGKLKHLSLTFPVNKINEYYFQSCILAKHHKFPFCESQSIAPACFELLHMDLWVLIGVLLFFVLDKFLVLDNFLSYWMTFQELLGLICN